MSKSKKKETLIRIPEVKVTFESGNFVEGASKIVNSRSAADVLRLLIEPGEMELHEMGLVLFLNRNNKPIGYYRHSVGGVSQTVIDGKIVTASAIKCLASGIIICHNHPSGNLEPSLSDKTLTANLRKTCKEHDVDMLDHIILTKDSYYSFADQGSLGSISGYEYSDSDSSVFENPDSPSESVESKATLLYQRLLKF